MTFKFLLLEYISERDLRQIDAKFDTSAPRNGSNVEVTNGTVEMATTNQYPIQLGNEALRYIFFVFNGILAI